jgi:hypothetical protein
LENPLDEFWTRVRYSQRFQFQEGEAGRAQGAGGVMSAAEALVGELPSYVYEVRIQSCRGVWKRWQGRVVMIDPTGRRYYWRPRRARTRDALIAGLWEDATADIRWRTRSGTIALVEGVLSYESALSASRQHHASASTEIRLEKCRRD